MRVELVTPSPPGTVDGNRITALRWARLIRSLGHRTRVTAAWSGARVDVLVSLHAVKSRASASAFRAAYPRGALVVCATGTDVYASDQLAAGTATATRIVALQPDALRALPPSHLRRAVVIRQSASAPARSVARLRRPFPIAVVANLRPIKDPLRPALATRRLPATSRIRVVLVGAGLSPSLEARATREAERNPRFAWRGPLPPGRTRHVIAASHAVAIPSRHEGSSNVLCEALAARTPVIAADAPGLIGTLGPSYPGLYPVGDTTALRDRMHALETDPAFAAAVRSACARLRPLVAPKRERAAWGKLLRDLA